MAFGGLKKWFEDRVSNVGNVVGAIAHGINPLDNGQGWTNKPVNTSNTPQERADDARLQAAVRQARSNVVSGSMTPQQARGFALSNAAFSTPTFQRAITPDQAIYKPGQKLIDIATNRKVAPVAMGIGRSAAGTAESLSGLYDLATPGVGQNRFGKIAQNAGVTADKVVDREAYNKLAYKGGQAFGDVATFMASGAPIAKGVGTVTNIASKAPVIGRAITSVDEAAKAGNLVAKGAKYLTRPDVASDIIADTALNAGFRSNRGKEVTPGSMAVDAGMSVGMGAGIGLAGYGAKQAYKGAKKAAPEVIDAAKTVKYITDKLDPSVRELDRQYDQLNKQWQASSPQARRNIDAAIKQNRLERNRYTRVAFGNSMLDVSGDPRFNEELPDNALDKVVQPKISNITPSRELLPTNGVKLTGNVDKAFRSTRSIIERQGKTGAELANDLQRARDVEEIYQAEILKQIPTVRKLKGSDYENFVDATQGVTPPANPKVAQAVAEWKAVHPTIRDRAVAAGLDVGDLGPNYYPHMIDYDAVFKDKNKYNQAINHIVETGQAPSVEEAVKLLGYARDVSRNRKFGNLEASRLVDIPFYDKSKQSLTSYIQGSSKRIAQTETFGKNDEIALKKIAQIGQEGGDTEAAKNAYDVAVGAKRYSPTASKISGGIRKYNTTTKLGLGALTNVSQNVNTGIVTGHLRTAKAMVKQLSPQTREFVGDTGVIADAVINDLKQNQGYTTFTSKVIGRGLNLITAPAFGAVEKFNRAVAATAGRDYALRLAQKGDEATLRKLGVTGKIGKELTEDQQIQAARKVVEKTQFKVDPQDLPGWVDSPGGKLVAQFRTFSYNQGKFFSNEIIKPMAKGNVMPMARLLAAMPLGYALYETRRAIDGRPEEENLTKRTLAVFNKIGGAGLVSDVYQGINPIGSKYLPSDRRQSMAVSTFGGPAAGTAAQAVGALSDTIQRKNIPKDESRLEGKVAVGKTGDSYTDLTSLSRFGLSQVPVVGSAIKNRVLPYKKESNADAGKDPLKDAIASKASAASSSTGKDDFNTIAKAAFGSAEGKKFMALKNDDERKAFAQESSDNRALYNQYVAMKKTFTGGDKLLASGLDDKSTKVLQKYDRMTDKAKETTFNRDKAAEYEYELANYENKKANGEISRVEEINQQQKLKKMKVASDFEKQYRDVYDGLSKSEVYDLITSDKDDKKIADQLLSLDDALVKAGVIDKSKFRDKYGNVSFEPSSKKSGGKGKGKGKGGRKGRKGSGIAGIKISTPPTEKMKLKLAGGSPGVSLRKPSIKVGRSKTYTIKGMKSTKIA